MLTPLQLLSHKKDSKLSTNWANNKGDKLMFYRLMPRTLEKIEDRSPLYGHMILFHCTY